MASRDSIIKGGASGHTVVPGSADSSELIRRITLDPSNKSFMPADGKKMPLSSDEVKILTWWIQAGAPTGLPIGSMSVGAETVQLLSAALAARANAAGSAVSTAAPSAADPAVVNRIYESGFLVRQLSRQDSRLAVAVGGGGSKITDNQWGTLAASGGQVVELDLRRSHVGDTDLPHIGQLSTLRRLHLEDNAISDAGLRALAKLTNLEYLNLYGNSGITDASVETLASLPSLKRLYVWGTQLTPAGVKALATKRLNLIVNDGEAIASVTPKE